MTEEYFEQPHTDICSCGELCGNIDEENHVCCVCRGIDPLEACDIHRMED